MTDKTCDRWTKTGNGNNPVSFKHVLVAVDGVVMVGFWNELRNLWFSGDRPVYPQYWRTMPKLPKGLK